MFWNRKKQVKKAKKKVEIVPGQIWDRKSNNGNPFDRPLAIVVLEVKNGWASCQYEDLLMLGAERRKIKRISRSFCELYDWFEFTGDYYDI